MFSIKNQNEKNKYFNSSFEEWPSGSIFSIFCDCLLMGAIRSVPNSEMRVQAEKLEDLNFVSASLCGWQHYMEDYTGYAQVSPKESVFFVIDGHGGPDLAEIATELIPSLLRNNQALKTQNYKAALEQLIEALDSELKSKTKEASAIREKQGIPPYVGQYPTSGLSIVIALVSINEITIANVGECKSYVSYCSNLSKAVLISGNHSQSNAEDEARVISAGGFFVNGRLNGMFPYTRSIGDYTFKNNEALSKAQQLMVCTPSIFSLRKKDMKTIVLGSSGLWQQPTLVMKIITQDDFELSDLRSKTEKLMQELVSPDPRKSEKGLKNMSILVIDLKH